MSSRRDLSLEEKIHLIKEKDRGLSHRQLSDRFQVSVGSVSNILKRKLEYTNDYETNRNKKVKRKLRDDTNFNINENVYEWFVSQRSKHIPISGPILQEYARGVAEQLGTSTPFKASNGWLDRFRSRYNIQFRAISGEARSVDTNTVEDWKTRLHSIIEHYDPKNVFNVDETGLFFKLLPDQSYSLDRNDCRGGKKSKERYTVMLCTNWSGNEKMKPVVIGT
jgi:transposase